MTKQKITVKGIQIILVQKNREDYISLTDIAKHKSLKNSDDIIKNWLRNKTTIEFLTLWEKLNNTQFKGVEFHTFKPVEFDGFKNHKPGTKEFSLTPSQWISRTNAIGIISKPGRYGGGTFAHKDIAFEFASWISPEFKLYLIKEFQRLKENENNSLKLNWDLKRNLTKINYKIHTDSIKNNLIPEKISTVASSGIYANEADILNKALFGMTAKEWNKSNPDKKGNIRDFALASQLVCLSNLESLNAEFIRQKIPQSERLLILNEIAIIQMKSLTQNTVIKKLTS